MMRQLFISFLLLISACTAGLSQFTMVSSSASWSTVDDSTYTATVSFYSDLTGQSYNASQIVDTFLVYSANEQLYRISVVEDPFFSSATLTIIERDGDWGEPSGQVCVYDPDGRTTIPEAVFGSNGATAQLLSAVGRYNARQIGTGGTGGSPTGAAGGDLSGSYPNPTLDAAAVKSKYESNSNTNAFTDAEQSKLTGIEDGATADQSPTEIRDALDGLSGADRLDAGAVKNIPILVPVFLFIGESNSSGRALNSDATADELAPKPEVQILNNTTLVFEDLDIGTNNELEGNNDDLSFHGWELELANQVQDSLGLTKVWLLKTGQGGSAITDWETGDPYYTAFVTRVGVITDSLESLGLRPHWVVFQSQGINDAAAAADSTTFSNDMIEFHGNVRSVLGQSAAPIIMTRIMQNDANYVEIDEAIQDIADTQDNTYAVSITGATIKGDNVHWDYDGMKLITQRMLRLVRDSLGYPAANFRGLPAFSTDIVPADTVIRSVTGGGILPVEWGNLTNCVDEGGGNILLSGSAQAGAIGSATISSDSNFTLVARLDSLDLTDNEGIVLYIDDDSSTNFNYNSSNDYIAGWFISTSDGNIRSTEVGGAHTASYDVEALDRYVRMRKSGDDIILEYSDDDDTYTTLHTYSNILVGAPSDLYIKVLFAAVTGTKRLRNVRYSESSIQSYKYIDWGDGEETSLYRSNYPASLLSPSLPNGSIFIQEDSAAYVKEVGEWKRIATLPVFGADVSVAATPSNYTAVSAIVEEHLVGIDNALDSTTHKILAFTQIEDTATEVVQRGEEITIDGDNTAASSFTVTLDITGLEVGDVFDIYIGDATINNITLQLSSGTNNISYEKDGLSTTKTFSGTYHSLYCRWDGSALRIDER